VTMVTVSSAPLATLQAFRSRMGWNFEWVSCDGNDFNRDFHVTFGPEDKARGEMVYNYRTSPAGPTELPGISVFAKDESGAVFHTYSSYARGLDILLGAHNILDLTPNGRNEKRIMDWVRRHDEYEETAPCCHAQSATAA